MVVVGISDIHGDVRMLDRLRTVLAEADLVVASGDLTTFGDRGEAKRVVDAIRGRCKRLLAIPGNCDTPEVALYLEEAGCALHGRSHVEDGLVFVGVGGSLPCPGRTPTEYTEADFAALFETACKDVPADHSLVLVGHQPPIDTAVDTTHGGEHVGSRSVRAFIETRAPILCMCGHIHESRNTDVIGSTKIVNPGPLREGTYAYAQVGREVNRLEIRTC